VGNGAGTGHDVTWIHAAGGEHRVQVTLVPSAVSKFVHQHMPARQ
jgi:hypothetical protein